MNLSPSPPKGKNHASLMCILHFLDSLRRWVPSVGRLVRRMVLWGEAAHVGEP